MTDVRMMISMDPVQTDLKRLGVKPSEEGDYNIHTPPFPGTSKWTCICLQSECFCLTEDSKFINKYNFEGKCFNILYFLMDFLEDACMISLLCVFLFVAGSPLIVYISISLRNILDIDELRQVILLQCHHHITTSQH